MFRRIRLLLADALLALLVSNTAGSFASGLAGGLAFAATAGLDAGFQVASLDGLDSFHNMSLLDWYGNILTRRMCFVNRILKLRERSNDRFVSRFPPLPVV